SEKTVIRTSSQAPAPAARASRRRLLPVGALASPWFLGAARSTPLSLARSLACLPPRRPSRPRVRPRPHRCCGLLVRPRPGPRLVVTGVALRRSPPCLSSRAFLLSPALNRFCMLPNTHVVHLLPSPSPSAAPLR
uniref:Uncharacterized protein n=1 Tax=Aegilops tauschii subsp. strangulata TaxID=200361 RepID=A0A453S7B2_AEGTS